MLTSRFIPSGHTLSKQCQFNVDSTFWRWIDVVLTFCACWVFTYYWSKISTWNPHTYVNLTGYNNTYVLFIGYMNILCTYTFIVSYLLFILLWDHKQFWCKNNRVYKSCVVNNCTLQPLYNTVHYNTVLDITRCKDGSQKCIDFIEKWP